MAKGIVITEHGEWYEYEYSTVQDVQDVTKGYFEGLALYDVQGDSLGFMYINEMGHGLINTPASALSFMFGGASTINGNVLVVGPACPCHGATEDVLPIFQELAEYTCSERKDPANV